jgi:hypothetical protein
MKKADIEAAVIAALKPLKENIEAQAKAIAVLKAQADFKRTGVCVGSA